MAPSKLDHRELQKRLKEDELTHYIGGFRDRVQLYWTQFGGMITAALAVLVLVLAFVWWLNSKSANDFRQSQLYFGNASAFVQQGDYQQALGQLNQLIAEYSGAEIIPAAYMLRGDCYFQTAQYDQALSDYRKAISMLDEAGAIPARIALIQTLRSAGNSQQAMEELQQMEAKAQTKELKDMLAYTKAGIYEDLNQTQQALEAYQSIDSTSSWYNLALARVDWLTTEPAAAIN